MRIALLIITIWIWNAQTIHGQIPQKKIPKLKIFANEAIKMQHLKYIEIDSSALLKIKEMPIFWSEVNKISFQASEVAFTNWNGGGANNISVLLGIDLERNYKDKNFKWDNQLIIRSGANKQSGESIRKTEDRLEINSRAGFRLNEQSNWYYLGSLTFSTQFFNGFNFPNTRDIISQFMAPGYLFLGMGVEHKLKKQNFYLYLSPITFKSTFVLDQNLANEGAFGVRKAIRDNNDNIVKEGDRVRVETGFLVNTQYQKEILHNINLENNLTLYTDYINNFGNIDIDWEVNISFKVNQYIKANFGSHIRYDDDVKLRIEQEDGSFVQGGSRVQWKQQFGIGLVVEL